MKEIKVKYFNKDYPRLEKINKGDWVDLRVDSLKEYIRGGERQGVIRDGIISSGEMGVELEYYKGDILFLGLGVAMELPAGYEAHIAPRSSTFKNTGLILTNGIGIIDNSYNGDKDEWKAMVYCTRDGILTRHDRLFQFRLQENQPEIEFKEVGSLGNASRGGYGSTGRD